MSDKDRSGVNENVLSGPTVSAQPPTKVVEITESLLLKAQRLQEPAVAKYVASLREKYPDDSPAQLITRLEKRYLTTVTSAGGAVGATAAVPGVGTLAALGAITGETVLFLEASALLALAIAEVHGIGIHEVERRNTLVLTVALGEEGLARLGRVVGSKGGPLRSLSRSTESSSTFAKLNKSLAGRLAKRYTLKRAPMVIGKMLPAGIGAVVGGLGNRTLGRRVITNAREVFGPPPSSWTVDGIVVDDLPAAPGGSAAATSLRSRRRELPFGNS
ncbi:MAG: hypothetical protein QM662_15425 [Gordonia sp. (in: high G+C Gram-positive bacteria)]